MSPSFPYLTGTDHAPGEPATAADVSQEEGKIARGELDGGGDVDKVPAAEYKEQFNDDADAREFVFPNLDQDVAPGETTTLAQTRGAQWRLEDQRPHSTPTPARTTAPTTPATPENPGETTPPAPRRVGFNSPTAVAPVRHTACNERAQQDSALTEACENSSPIRTPEDLYKFLEWQLNRKESLQEQAKFKDDAMGYPGLLVFAIMRPKVPFIQFLHSMQAYPNALGSDPAWKGKTIGFLGDRTSYSLALQMVELKEKAPWAWENRLVVNDLTVLDQFYMVPGNANTLWTLDPTVA
jgi:hypothetical protein